MFILITLNWFINKELGYFQSQYLLPYATDYPVIEKAYKGRDFYSSFDYIPIEFAMRNLNPIDPEKILIYNEEHLQSIVRRYSVQLVDQMFKNGCIEMKDVESYDDPYHRRVTLKVKVYQPEK